MTFNSKLLVGWRFLFLSVVSVCLCFMLNFHTTTPTTKLNTPITNFKSEAKPFLPSNPEIIVTRYGFGENTVGLPFISQESTDWCHEVTNKYSVKPMQSWGSMSRNHIDTWLKLDCESVFSNMRKMKLSSCLPNSSVGVKDSINISLPLIAIMTSSTTSKKHNKSRKNGMPLFRNLLPSLIRTLDCGFRYVLFLGYQSGDVFYDKENGVEKTRQWFKANVTDIMVNRGIQVTLRVVRLIDASITWTDSGPVFNRMARVAYNTGADYFYRVNDETELSSNWATALGSALNNVSGSSFPRGFGVAGPSNKHSFYGELSHHFTSRLHMEIFNLTYCPSELLDASDISDWLSLVYHNAYRTFVVSNVSVIQHSMYRRPHPWDNVELDNMLRYVDIGRETVKYWLEKNNV